MFHFRMFSVVLSLCIVAFASVPVFAQIELIQNGGFETGDFSHWKRWQQAGSPGEFQISGESQTPSEQFPTPGAFSGDYYAVTDSNAPGTDGPSAYALYQAFMIPQATEKVTLHFDMFVNDWFGQGALNTNGLIDYTQSTPTQFVRVDILTSDANPFTISPSDIVSNIYLGLDGIAPPYSYSGFDIDLTSLTTSGQTYQLRFASVANQFSLNMGVDNVSITTVSAPEPGAFALFALGISTAYVVNLCLRRNSG